MIPQATVASRVEISPDHGPVKKIVKREIVRGKPGR